MGVGIWPSLGPRPKQGFCNVCVLFYKWHYKKRSYLRMTDVALLWCGASMTLEKQFPSLLRLEIFFIVARHALRIAWSCCPCLQWSFVSRNIGQLTPKIIYFYYQNPAHSLTMPSLLALTGNRVFCSASVLADFRSWHHENYTSLLSFKKKNNPSIQEYFI